MRRNLIFAFFLCVLLGSCSNNNDVPKDLINFVKKSYEKNQQLNQKGLFDKKPKIGEVIAATQLDPQKLPDWIAKKQYITENADAIKYEPILVIGALARLYNDGTFDVYPVTYNVRLDNELPELSKIGKPVNFYEQTFNSSTRFNADFLIGGLSIGNDEILKVTYTETNYINLKKIDAKKLESLRTAIKDIPGTNLKDWAIIRGVVILDCTYSRNTKTDANTNVKASWVSTDGAFFKQTTNTDNFRLISIDFENLFL